MKFSGNTQEIMDGISIVTRALASKPAKQVFEGVHVQCDGNTLTLSCSDGTFSISWTGNVNVQEPGDAIIQGKLFAELMRKLPNTTVTITTDSKSATIAYNKSRSRLAVIAGEYPEAKPVSNPATISIPSLAMKDIITHILPAIATDSTRIILTGGLLDISNGQLTAVALDGFRLALKLYELGSDTQVSAIVPRKTLQELSRVLPTSDDPVTLRISKDAISADIGNAHFYSILLVGEYLDYSKLIPQEFATRVRTDISSLSDAIDRANLMAREGKNNLVKLSVHDNTISVSSQSETGQINEELDCDQQGKDITIAFNSAYLSDAIRNIPGDTAVLNFNSPTTPAVISPETGTDWIYLILPVRTF